MSDQKAGDLTGDQQKEQQEQQQQEQHVESEAAFEAGFSSEEPAPAPAPKEKSKTEEPTKEDEAAKQEAAAVKGDEPGKEPDLKAELANIHEQLKALGNIGALDHRLKSMEGRYASVQRQIEELAAAKAAAATVPTSPSKAQIDAASGDTEKWKRIKEDYPEWAEAMDERLSAFKVEPPKIEGFVSKEDFEKQVGQIRESVRADVRTSIHEDLVEDMHEGWKQTVSSDEFKGWFKAQPANVQALANSPRARDAIRLLDSFKAAKQDAANKAEEQRKKDAELDATTTPKGTRGRGSTPHISDEDAFESGFNAA